MENSIYLGLSKQMVLRTDMDIIANNIANMNTTGYRGQNTLFDEYVSKPRGYDDASSFVEDRGQYEVTDPGPISFTGNPLDVSLFGPGFMGVQGPTGEVMYTRAGDFQRSAEGILTTSAGYPVADPGGANIVIPAGSTEVKIDERGFVSNQDGTVGQIQIAEFADLQDIKPFGHGLYMTDQAPLPPENTRMKQGQLEGSNIKPVVEMSRMIETLREFQTVQNILKSENDRLRGAIQKLTGGG
jgi:flagellar basal-body rod protein FlgF